VKCEKKSSGYDLPPLQTFRTCTKIYLQKEIETVPDNLPLIAVGIESYKALSYLFASRTVIGVPHPTGSYGQFHKLFNNGSLRPEIKTPINGIVNRREVVWVPDLLK
jgi:hypothetical protein